MIDNAGQAAGIVIAGNEFTARKRAETALRDSEERLRHALEAGRMVAWEWDIATGDVYRSGNALDVLGLGAGANADFHALIHPDDRAKVVAARDAALGGGADFDVEYRLTAADGRELWVVDRARVERDAHGQPVRMTGILTDITARKAADRTAIETMEQFTGLADNISQLAWMTEPDGYIYWYNRRWYDYTGTTLDTMKGWGWQAVHHPDHIDRVTARFKAAIADGEEWEDVFPLRGKDGAYRWFLSRAMPIRDADGKLIRWFGTNTDITEQRETEAALVELTATLEQRVASATAEREAAMAQVHEMQKLETIGQLTGGVAHDFNNLLTPIVGSLDLIRHKLDDERSQRLIAGAQQAAERARTLVSRLLTFARRQHLEPRTVDLAGLARGMEDLIARSIGPQIEVVFDLARGMPTVRVDPNQLELAILNLAVNARDAMPGGGKLTIAADEAEAGEIEEVHGLAPGRYVRLCIIDTGCGMDAETLRRATEPFYSTKGIGKGTGLGVSMAHGLAGQSGGALVLKSHPGEGTTATLWLPVAGEAATGNAKADEGTIAPSRPRSILLVDDEELVRMGAADMLVDLGHRVREADSGARALEMLESDCGIELIVTDYLMPGMTGAELVRRARAMRPGLPALLMTGYADLADDVGRGLPRLPKPFRRIDLAAGLAALDSAAAE